MAQPVDIRIHEQCRPAVSSLTHINSGARRVVYLFRTRQVDHRRKVDVENSRSCVDNPMGEVIAIQGAYLRCVTLLGL